MASRPAGAQDHPGGSVSPRVPKGIAGSGSTNPDVIRQLLGLGEDRGQC